MWQFHNFLPSNKTIFLKKFQKVLLTNVTWDFFSIAKWQIFAQKKKPLHYYMGWDRDIQFKVKCQIPLFWVKERAKFLSLGSSTLVFWTQSLPWFLNFDFWKVQLLTLYYLVLLYSSRGASTRSGRCPWNLFEDTKGDLPFCLSRKVQIELYCSNLIFFHFYKPTNLLSAIETWASSSIKW